MKKLWSSSPVLFLREALLLYFSRRVPQAAASLAYFVLLTVFPVLICVSYLLGLVNIDVVSLIDQLQTVFPEAALDVVESYLVYISSHQSIGLFFAGLAAGWFSAAAAFRTVTQVIVDMYDEVSQSMLRGLVSSILFPLALLVTVKLSVLVVVSGQRTLAAGAQRLRFRSPAAVAGVWVVGVSDHSAAVAVPVRADPVFGDCVYQCVVPAAKKIIAPFRKKRPQVDARFGGVRGFSSGFFGWAMV